MRILFVEDDFAQSEFFREEIAKLSGVDAVFAADRDSAFTELNANIFDMIVLDLKIPATIGSAEDRLHGESVHAHILLKAQGTPTIICSGFGDAGVVADFAERRGHGDPWGKGTNQALTIHRDKTKLAECLALIGKANEEVKILESIDISTRGKELELKRYHITLLRLYARLNGGENVSVSSLGGGLSSARTLRVEIHDAKGSIVSRAVAKLDTVETVRKERSRYQKFITPNLDLGAFAHEISFVECGAGEMGGLFYGLAGKYAESGFDLLRRDPRAAGAMVRSLREFEKAWEESGSQEVHSVRDIRRGLISDEAMVRIAGEIVFDWQALENISVKLWMCPQHRDLHLFNVLIRDGVVPLFIDYGEVGRAPGCLDPITLELSLLFHPGCKVDGAVWPTLERAAIWPDVAQYGEGCSCIDFVRECRNWAFARPTDRGVFAVVYAYAMRQLKYPDTNHKLALVIAEAARSKIIGV